MRYILITCFLCSLLCCKEHEEKPPLLPEVVLTIDTVRDDLINMVFNEVVTMSKDSSILFYSAFYTQYEKPDFSIMKFNDVAFFYEVDNKNRVTTIAQLKDVKYNKHKLRYTCEGILLNLEKGVVCEYNDGKHFRCGNIVWDDKLNPPH